MSTTVLRQPRIRKLGRAWLGTFVVLAVAGMIVAGLVIAQRDSGGVAGVSQPAPVNIELHRLQTAGAVGATEEPFNIELYRFQVSQLEVPAGNPQQIAMQRAHEFADYLAAKYAARSALLEEKLGHEFTEDTEPESQGGIQGRAR